MRRVVRSRTYVTQLKIFIEQGAEPFGAAVFLHDPVETAFIGLASEPRFVLEDPAAHGVLRRFGIWNQGTAATDSGEHSDLTKSGLPTSTAESTYWETEERSTP